MNKDINIDGIPVREYLKLLAEEGFEECPITKWLNGDKEAIDDVIDEVNSHVYCIDHNLPLEHLGLGKSDKDGLEKLLEWLEAYRFGEQLYDADPNCKHEIVEQMSGIKCSKCNGWFCY